MLKIIDYNVKVLNYGIRSLFVSVCGIFYKV